MDNITKLYNINDKKRPKNLVINSKYNNIEDYHFLRKLIYELNNNKLDIDQCKEYLTKANFLVSKRCSMD